MAELFDPGTPVDFSKSIDPSILKGRTALVTGGASGIGLAIVHALVEAGTQVTIVDFNEHAGTAIAESLQAKGHLVNFVKTDVASWDDQVAAFEKAASSSPSKTVDIVITSAGIEGKLADMPPLLELDRPMKPSTRCLEVNFNGTYYSAILALWYFARSPPNPAKQLLFLCSAAGYASPMGERLNGDYESSKFAVRGLFQKLHPRAKGYGEARINMLCPTFVDTPLLSPGTLEKVRASGLKTAVTADVADGAMRCLTDGDVSGRAVLIGGGEANGGGPGSANFDICDDILNHFGGKALLENVSRLISLPGA
jgi:5'-hydroxyaverantin dehydrogenase